MSKTKEKRRKEHRQNAQKKAEITKRPFFVNRYNSVSDLYLVGPIFNATWHVPEAIALALTAAKKPTPPPISGQVLVDTGARDTCIAEEVALALDLKPSNQVVVLGAHGAQERELYTARLAFHVTVKDQQIEFGIERPVIAIPELEKSSPPGIHGGHPIRLIGLLGRDFLRFSKFTYEGTNGQFRFELDLGAFPKKP